MAVILLYILCGAVAGFISGLIGIGGGLVVVPLLNMIFQLQDTMSHETIMHVAVGTSLSSILFTALSSARSHARRGAVRWDYVKGLAPSIIFGTICASALASQMSAQGLRLFFVVFLICIATQMFFDLYPAHNKKNPPENILSIPRKGMLAVAGLFIGGASSLVGLGGGSMSVPFLRFCGVEIRHAIGTSAAISWPIAISGTIGFIIAGWNSPGLPPLCFGYVNLPATLGIACMSVFLAPIGARLAHRLPISVLRRFFACFLYVTAAEMTWNILH